MMDRAEEFEDRAALAVAHLRLSAIFRTRGGSKSLKAAEAHLDQAAGYDRRRRPPWLPQLHTERALVSLAKDDLHGAREAVRQCREVRPHRDTQGKLIDLLNFAAIDIRDGQYEPAHGHLLQALDLAEILHDLGGQAHAQELRGIVHWEQQNQADAKRDWERADAAYRDAGDAAGSARCARHQRRVRGVAAP